jgi:hypothetical protein
MPRYAYTNAARQARPRYQHYHCSACGGIFKFFHASSDSLPPDCCQLCGAFLDDSADPVFIPNAPLIRKNLLVKSEHQLYRQMEASSIARAEEAASVAGVSKNEMSHLKITNMREAGEMREGDTAAIMPPSNVVGQVMGQHPNMTGFNTQQPGSAYALGRPDAGALTHNTTIMPNHRDVAARMTAAGQLRRPG